MLQKIVSTKSLRLVGQVAFYRANSVNDDIHIFDETQSKTGTPKAIFHGLRQQVSLRQQKDTHSKTALVSSAGNLQFLSLFLFIGIPVLGQQAVRGGRD